MVKIPRQNSNGRRRQGGNMSEKEVREESITIFLNLYIQNI